MLVSSDIKFISRDPKQRRNGEICRASPTHFSYSLINLISKANNMVFTFHASSAVIQRLGHEPRQRIKTDVVLTELAVSYDVIR